MHIKDGGCPCYSDIREKYYTLEDDNNLEVLMRRDALDDDNCYSGDLAVTGVLLANRDPATVSPNGILTDVVKEVHTQLLSFCVT